MAAKILGRKDEFIFVAFTKMGRTGSGVHFRSDTFSVWQL